jgi:GNAT superfamily N-acetyltransferase
VLTITTGSGPGWSRIYYPAAAAESGPVGIPVPPPADAPPRIDERRWSATVGGEVVGAASAAPNPGATFVRVFVDEGARRRGVGRALLQAIRDSAAPGSVLRAVVVAGGPGFIFADSFGATVRARLVVMELRLPARIPLPPTPDRYSFRAWSGRTPDELLDSYAAVKCHIADAPDSAAQLDPEWTPERVRAAESPGRFVGAAVHNGAVVAFTEIDAAPGAVAASQEDTVVAPAHRGHRLGIAVKAALAATLHRARPDILAVTSTIDAENAPMLATCRAAGWTEIRRRDLVELRA